MPKHLTLVPQAPPSILDALNNDIARVMTETHDSDGQRGWQRRHVMAMTHPVKFESAIVGLLVSLAQYADCAMKEFDWKIGEDYVLGPHFLDIARAVYGLLDGETGRLDCGSVMDHLNCILKAAGFEETVSS